ncbi:hypothetical protein [Lentilactobacillus rapi]|uniref:Uncharacterized protein n=3 Tax=Lactobacillaceae TaxID=33958 RepID=A0A512PLF6_9LACO|nr:hypothetical protein [Lentilactobacillus rapi]GEP72003.1 hypothetical protein LRA02_08710 [Lentilactobacillus rapi]
MSRDNFTISMQGSDGKRHELHGFEDSEALQFSDNRTPKQKKEDAKCGKILDAIGQAIDSGKAVRFTLNSFSYDGTFGILLQGIGGIVGSGLAGLYTYFPELLKLSMHVDYTEKYVDHPTGKMQYPHSDVDVYVTFYKDSQMPKVVFDSEKMADVKLSESDGEHD